jgi:hypothetical protein
LAIIHYWHWAVVMLSWMKDKNEKIQRTTVENNGIEEDDKMLNGIPLNKNVSNTEGRKNKADQQEREEGICELW